MVQESVSLNMLGKKMVVEVCPLNVSPHDPHPRPSLDANILMCMNPIFGSGTKFVTHLTGRLVEATSSRCWWWDIGSTRRSMT